MIKLKDVRYPDDFQKTIDQYKKKAGILTDLQQKIQNAKIPIVILFEGWGASGKGNAISNLLEYLDPRGFKVFTIGERTGEEQRFPTMRRYHIRLPEYGKISIFDRSWYRDVSTEFLESDLLEAEQDRRYAHIAEFEQLLADDGYVLLKFFLHIDKEEQAGRLKKLEANQATAWRVTNEDWKRNQRYEQYEKCFENMLNRTQFKHAPWTVVDASNKDYTKAAIGLTVINAMQQALARKKAEIHDELNPLPVRTDERIMPKPIAKLKDIDPNMHLKDKAYKHLLKDDQKHLFELHNKLYKSKRPLILVYEGWDAAGKGGNIKRMTEALDPRGYEVVPISSPNTIEKNHPFVWRFWNALPKDGHIAIFDRSWYGRVMVERIEGFCTQAEWSRAYDEINKFEKELSDWGAIIVKFWLHIDPDTQLKRFMERKNTPAKEWKITSEDWRNRAKWQQYEQCVDQMLALTHTEYAPWVVVESNDKQYARIKALESVIEHIEKRL